jgi:hypothetical protein
MVGRAQGGNTLRAGRTDRLVGQARDLRAMGPHDTWHRPGL